MTDLVWYDAYRLGLESIDSEHKNLLLIMQRIKKLIIDNQLSHAAIAFAELLDDANEHFRSEEKLLEDTAYPGLQSHKDYHQGLITQVINLKSMCEQMIEQMEIQKCFDAMAAFLIDDILRGDIYFKSHLQEAGLIEVPYEQSS